MHCQPNYHYNFKTSEIYISNILSWLSSQGAKSEHLKFEARHHHDYDKVNIKIGWYIYVMHVCNGDNTRKAHKSQIFLDQQTRSSSWQRFVEGGWFLRPRDNIVHLDGVSWTALIDEFEEFKLNWLWEIHITITFPQIILYCTHIQTFFFSYRSKQVRNNFESKEKVLCDENKRHTIRKF